jgi:hypothetical protein
LTIWRVLLEITSPAHLIPGIFRESFMKRVKSPCGRYVESDESSPEDEKELARLLRIFSGRGSVSDWEPKEEQQRG